MQNCINYLYICPRTSIYKFLTSWMKWDQVNQGWYGISTPLNNLCFLSDRVWSFQIDYYLRICFLSTEFGLVNYDRWFKISNSSCLPERQIVQTQIRLIRVLPVCNSDKYFVEFQPWQPTNIIFANGKRKEFSRYFLFLYQNICCGYSKEPSQWDCSFEHQKHMLQLMGKKIIKILRK